MSEREAYGWLLAELESSRLEVILCPCRRRVNEGGCIRVVASRNAAWYRRLCAAHPSGRKRKNAAPDTRVRRANIARVLARLAAGRGSASRYVPDLVRAAARVRKSA